MHALAKAKNVPFQEIPDKEAYRIPSELQALSDKFVAGDYSITPAEDTLLKRRYIHISGNWNHPHGRETGDGLTLRYINSPMEDGIRVRHPHIPS
ncbi:Rhs element Vgr protein [Pseudomonas taetrolens]|nr:Rhs element Vgr protein [Pseudomonas taetrolens]